MKAVFSNVEEDILGIEMAGEKVVRGEPQLARALRVHLFHSTADPRAIHASESAWAFNL
jgi:hypothetical protein